MGAVKSSCERLKAVGSGCNLPNAQMNRHEVSHYYCESCNSYTLIRKLKMGRPYWELAIGICFSLV